MIGRLFRSAVQRLIAIHFGLIAAATALVLAYVFVSTNWLIEVQVREVVSAELRGLEDEVEARGVFGLAAAIDRRARSNPGGDGVYLLTAPDGRRLAGNLLAWPRDLPPGAGWVELTLTRTDRREPSIVSALALSLPRGERLLIGRDAEARRRFGRTLLSALVTALAVLAALTLLAAWGLSRLLRRRLGALAETAEQVMAGDLSHRAPVAETAARGGGDEFDRLALSLNAMLDRIASLIDDLRMVTDSVAHDLRSPLTRLRGHLEAALAEGEAMPEAARERIERALGEAETTLEVFAGLLAIARAEAGVGREQFEPVALDALVEEMAGLYAPAAEAAGARLRWRAPPGLTIPAHRQLLAQALSNLIENALRYAPPGSEIGLLAEAIPGGAALAVSDEGPGVPAAERERMLRRFTQADPSRGGGGAGLGLALVAAVARLHGGEARLADAHPGHEPPGLAATLLLKYRG